MMKKLLLLVVMLLAGVAAFAQKEGDVPFNGLIINEAGKGVSRFKVKVKGARAHTLSDNQGDRKRHV